MSKFRKKPILIFVIALIALYIIIYIIPKVTGALVSSYTVEYGELKVADETQGYLVRDEQVYVSAASGKANRYIKGRNLSACWDNRHGSDRQFRKRSVCQIYGHADQAGGDAVSTSDFSVAKRRCHQLLCRRLRREDQTGQYGKWYLRVFQQIESGQRFGSCEKLHRQRRACIQSCGPYQMVHRLLHR